MIYKSIFLIALISLSSCSFFSKKVESLVDSSEKKEELFSKIIKKNLRCDDNNKIQLMLEDESTFKYYRPMISPLFESKNYSFIQKAAMLSLIEMARRPDKTSPSARLQFFIRIKGKDYYFDFRPKNLDDHTKMSYLKAIDFLLTNFQSPMKLSQLASLVDKSTPLATTVSPELEKFFVTYKNELIKNEFLNELFIKGDEAITKHESFKRSSLSLIVNNFYAQKLNNDSYYDHSKNALFKINQEDASSDIFCNTNIQKENHLKDEYFNYSPNRSHYFALKEDDQFFIAVSSAVIEHPLQNYKGSSFLKAKPNATAFPVCQFKNKNQDLILFSVAGRNPDQHLKHLLTYDINLIENYQPLEDLLNFSRHLFLNDPARILYESKRGRRSQLDFFLNMDFPIYHVESIGDIIGHAGFKKEKSLIVDDRTLTKLWCSP